MADTRPKKRAKLDPDCKTLEEAVKFVDELENKREVLLKDGEAKMKLIKVQLRQLRTQMSEIKQSQKAKTKNVDDEIAYWKGLKVFSTALEEVKLDHWICIPRDELDKEEEGFLNCCLKALCKGDVFGLLSEVEDDYERSCLNAAIEHRNKIEVKAGQWKFKLQSQLLPREYDELDIRWEKHSELPELYCDKKLIGKNEWDDWAPEGSRALAMDGEELIECYGRGETARSGDSSGIREMCCVCVDVWMLKSEK